jgi:ABC-type lipoprotein export system ATPase subunit
VKIEIHQQSEIERTLRVEMLETMFEVPSTTKLEVNLIGELPLEEKNWNIGLIVGPSGSGKTLILNKVFGEPTHLEWRAKSVIDDFASELSMESISRVCQSVGFNTIPSWLRPYSVLSNGERFRVEIARRLAQTPSLVLCDEFSSVVDRVVARVTSHAVQKYIRENNKQFVAASCHYDIIDWLQPDWILEPGRPCKFTWRSLQRRPSITCKVQRVRYETWELFREFHYMSQDLNKAARCYGLFIGKGLQSNGTEFSRILGSRCEHNELHQQSFGPGSEFIQSSDERIRRAETNGVGASEVRASRSESTPRRSGSYQQTVNSNLYNRTNRESESSEAAVLSDLSTKTSDLFGYPEDFQITSMCGVLHRPHPKVSDIAGFTRMVTLPDYQGLGLAFVLANTVASAYKALGKRLHSYPNHPAWIRSYQRSKDWVQVKSSGDFSPRRGATSSVSGFGGRRCAVFSYIGRPMSLEDAKKLVYNE